MPTAQLDLADLLARGAARLTADLPASPALAERLTRVLGERLPCRTKIHWICPVCRARTVTCTRCGPRCATCRAAAPPGINLLRQLPPVPVRHWVLTLPSPQRFESAGHPRHESTILTTFVRAIFSRLRTSAHDGCGAIVVVHRSGSALDLNLHLHALVPDGVFHRDHDFTARALTPDDLTAVARDVHRALARLPAATTHDPALAAVRTTARPRRTAGRDPRPLAAGTVRAVAGVHLFAGPPLPADDRAALRRLCDYITRPASTRLRRATGTPDELLLPLPPQPDATAHAALTARDVVARLVAATPDEPAITVRTYGALAPRAAHIWQLTRDRQLDLLTATSPPRPRGPRRPRCTRCRVALEALAVEDASDPPALTAAAAARTDYF